MGLSIYPKGYKIETSGPFNRLAPALASTREGDPLDHAALPAVGLEQVIEGVRALDMDDIRAQIATEKRSA